MKVPVLDLWCFSIAFNCILGIILLVVGVLLLAPGVRESLR
jgi:hypothetical protein